MLRQFEGKVALVTGGNSGIGKATAIHFAKAGAQVVIAARRVDEGMQTVEEIYQKKGNEIMFNRQNYQIARRFLLAILLLSFTMMGSLATTFPVQAADYVPLKGHFTGAGANFAGNFTHLGKFQGVVNAQTFTAVWTAANGDTVTNQTLTFELQDPIAPSVFRYEQTLIITGGTGRFVNAIGSATVTGIFNTLTGAFDGEVVGTISRPNRR